jgi:ketosteroid isomerase-like protein
MAPDPKAVEAEAHGGYVAAINSNDVDRILAMMTETIVYQAPHEPEIRGKAALRQWLSGYVGAYRTQWEKTPADFTISGDWAFERYTYKSTNTDKKTGVVSTDVGKGINIFHREPDGHWKVAIDGWSSDKPAAQ